MKLWRILPLALLATVQPGCRSCAPDIRKALEQPPAGQHAALEYTVGCPDVLEVAIGPRPDLSGVYQVEADGCISLKELGRLRVVGSNCEQITDLVVQRTGAKRADVDVSVAGPASRQILIFGPDQGAGRVAPYRGPESVTDFLRRNGGLDPRAEPFDINVVRPNVAVGRKPELFTVDLRAIVLNGDKTTDIVLEPNDQIYLGETRGSAIKRLLPAWMSAAAPK